MGEAVYGAELASELLLWFQRHGILKYALRVGVKVALG